MRTVVVTGAAGSLGQRVLRLLTDRSWATQVVAIDRIAPRTPHADNDWHEIDLCETTSTAGPDPLVGLLAGADVVHLAWTAGDARSLVRRPGDSNLRVLRRVLAAAEAGGAASFVHLSSATVYGAWADNPVPLTEESRLRPNPELGYAVEKAEAERLVDEWASDHPDTPVAVLRPAVVVGGPDRPLYRVLGGTRMPGTSESGRPVQFLHVDDLAAAVLVACERRLRGVYNVAPDLGTGEGTARQLSGGVAQVALPTRAARGVARWAWALARRGTPPEAQAYHRHPWVVAPDRMKAAGWVPRFSSEEALVVADDRSHWDDLPPGRLQEFTLLVGVAAGLLVAGATLVVVLALRRRRRR